jgi:hypothetical protein
MESAIAASKIDPKTIPQGRPAKKLTMGSSFGIM